MFHFIVHNLHYYLKIYYFIKCLNFRLLKNLVKICFFLLFYFFNFIINIFYKGFLFLVSQLILNYFPFFVDKCLINLCSIQISQIAVSRHLFCLNSFKKLYLINFSEKNYQSEFDSDLID